MKSDDNSYSDCNIEVVEKYWTKLLLNWINKCVHTEKTVKQLNIKSLVFVLNKYKQDIYGPNVKKPVFNVYDMQALLKHKYPQLKLRKNRRGGSCILIENSFQYAPINDFSSYSLENIIECSGIELIDYKIYVICVYRPPRPNTEDIHKFFQNLNFLLGRLCYGKKKVIICGDFNINMLKKTYEATEFMEILHSYNLKLGTNTDIKCFFELKDIPNKLYVMYSIMLFHCCVNSEESDVDKEICTNLTKEEQNMILKFCERLADMEVTASSIQCAIKDAYGLMNSNVKAKKEVKDAETLKELDSEYSKPSTSPGKSSYNTVTTDNTTAKKDDSELSDSTNKDSNTLKFKSSVTVLPSTVTDTSYSEVDYVVNYTSKSDVTEKEPFDKAPKVQLHVHRYTSRDGTVATESADFKKRCGLNCACNRCSPNEPCCGGEPRKGSMFSQQEFKAYHYGEKKANMFTNFPYELDFEFNWMIFFIVIILLLLIVAAGVLAYLYFFNPWGINKTAESTAEKIEEFRMSASQEARVFQFNSYICKNGFCEKLIGPTSEYFYSSLSRCTLLCTGPQIWPFPIGYTYYSKKIVSLATSRLEYKFNSVPSEAVHIYLAEAFKLFLGDIAKLEQYTSESRRNLSKDTVVKKMSIEMDVETDPDPRLRLDTDESYQIKIETIGNQVMVKLMAASFCGMRHGLETLSQVILLDQTTGYLITVSNMVIKDAPSYKYRGLMLDTARNFIPLPDIMRTLDAMGYSKLNTFHWRISDVTSFPLYLPEVPQLFEYGSYGRAYMYSKEDVRAVVKRAGIRGIRVVMEVSAPGPVGRPWSWVPEATCPSKNRNFTCSNILCLRLAMRDSVFDILQIIYTEILAMTKIEDVFHLSDSIFSLANCFYLIEEREGFLEKAIERLKMANKGFLPKLPIVWYSTHLTKDYEARAWDRFGVQLSEWQPNPTEQFLSRFKVIHSSRWDLSCEVKKHRCKRYRTWQDMYSWKSWRNIEVFTIEGGESILWTDLVDSGNLDTHLWPRAAAVAERLWSDIALNGSVSGEVYVRLDSQRWRMVLRSIQVQPVWPLYCSFNPGVCLDKLRHKEVARTISK